MTTSLLPLLKGPLGAVVLLLFVALLFALELRTFGDRPMRPGWRAASWLAAAVLGLLLLGEFVARILAA